MRKKQEMITVPDGMKEFKNTFQRDAWLTLQAGIMAFRRGI